jgi:carotenoid 1,2-hydratase
VGPNGYCWWYLDATSDDGQHALTVIVFVGSVFSPYYRFARRSGAANPENHVAFNVALYSRGANRWAMTERSASSLKRDETSFSIGASSVERTRSGLELRIDERCMPVPRTLRGSIKVTFEEVLPRAFALDRLGKHSWRPLAPRSRVELAFDHPNLRWSGDGYLDMNHGSEPLETAFSRWSWSRMHLSDRTRLLYDVKESDGRSHCVAVDAVDGEIVPYEAPGAESTVSLPKGLWGMKRWTRSDPGIKPTIVRALEDAPFYTRSLTDASLGGRRGLMVHESVDLRRFVSPVVQAMLPFRMPRLR